MSLPFRFLSVLISLAILSWNCGRKHKLILTENQDKTALVIIDSAKPKLLNAYNKLQDTLQDSLKNPALDTLKIAPKPLAPKKFDPPIPSDFQTLSAKIAIRYSAPSTTIPPLTGHLRLYKDSVIWLSLYSFGVIEVFRLYLTPHKIQLIDYLHSVAQIRRPDFLERFWHISFDFATLQAYLLGLGGRGEYYLQDTLSSEKSPDKSSEILTMGIYPNYRIWNKYSADSLLIESRFLANNAQEAQIYFKDFRAQPNLSLSFSCERSLTLYGQETAELSLIFKDLKWNQPLTFPFTIPVRYRIYSDF